MRASHCVVRPVRGVGVYVLTPKPGGAQSAISFVYKLPALTTFNAFAVPNVLETPSPSQTFVRKVEIAGSDRGQEGPFQVLGSATLETHTAKGQTTSLPVTVEKPVRWVRVTLRAGRSAAWLRRHHPRHPIRFRLGDDQAGVRQATGCTCQRLAGIGDGGNHRDWPYLERGFGRVQPEAVSAPGRGGRRRPWRTRRRHRAPRGGRARREASHRGQRDRGGALAESSRGDRLPVRVRDGAVCTTPRDVRIRSRGAAATAGASDPA